MPDPDDWPPARPPDPGAGRPEPGRPPVPGGQEENAPEYLTTGWSAGSSAPAAPQDGTLPTAVTMENSEVHPLSSGTGGDEALTVRLPDREQRQDRITAVWRGSAPAVPGRRRSWAFRLRRWALPVVLIAAAAVVVLWLRSSPGLAVTEVSVRVKPSTVGCDSAAEVVAVARTNGGSGTIRYRWVRSDGTVSGVLTQSVSARQEEAKLTLRWTFQGHGTQQANAVVDILSPTPRTASASFTYRCTR